MWAWMRVGADANTIGLIGAPVDKALMVVRDEHGPLRLRQLALPLLARAAAIESDLMAALAISVGARIHRIRQHMIDGDIAGVDPTDVAAVVGLQRKRQALAAQQKPDAGHRSELAEPGKYGTDGGADGLVGMEPHFAIFLTPDEADGKAATQPAASGLVANP